MIIEAIKALGVTEFACDVYPTKEAFESTYRSDSVDNPSITWEQVSEKIDELQAEFDAQEYARNRRNDYPDSGTQFNKIYDDGLTKWKSEMVDPVKTKWPKDNSGPV